MKIKFGALVTDGRGKIGGHVASKNRFCSYLRTKVTPVNPQTSYQSTVRTTLTNLSQNWRALTASQRASWNGAVQSFQTTNIFGDLKNPSGLNLYVRLNSNLTEIGVATIANAPLPNEVDGPATITLTAAAGVPAISLAWTGGAIPANMYWIVRLTPQVSPGKNFVKNLYRNLTVLIPADTTPENLLTLYNARFGTLVAGQKIFVEVVAVNGVSGIKGTPLSTSAIVAA